MKKILLSVGLLLGFLALQGAITPAAANDTYFYRIRFWDMATFSPGLQDQIRQVMKDESHATYAFSPGAVSRGLGNKMVAEWQQKTARTIRVCVAGVARVPVIGDNVAFQACPGQNRASPEDTYVEWKVPRANTLELTDPDFAVTIAKPSGCTIVYWPNKKDGGATGSVSTRGKRHGENEILASAKRPSSQGMNLEIILNCS